eukprot:6203119-Pleurochrysis_carterae.AAC.1
MRHVDVAHVQAAALTEREPRDEGHCVDRHDTRDALPPMDEAADQNDRRYRVQKVIGCDEDWP